MTSWIAVVPVKPWHSAKSRLDMPDELRLEMARALTLDTLDLLTTHPELERTVVVTADPHVEPEGRARGATVLIEQQHGLNEALRQGCSWVAARHPDSPTVVIPADLAYLTPEVLSRTLEALGPAGRAHVPDLSGVGTTLLAAPTASAIEPRYGARSSAAHTARGYERVDGVDARARADVDQLDDLTNEARWPFGRAVSMVVSRLALGA